MGCQKDIAKQIVDGGGDYVFALKGDQGTLREEVNEFLDDVLSGRLDAELDDHHSVDKDHGRIEERTVWVSRDVDWLRDSSQWERLSGIIVVESKRTIYGHPTTHRRHFICSGHRNAQQLGQIIRQHWRIENELHWALDVVFDEDQCRVRKDNAAENLSRLRRLTLSILKQDTKAKVEMQGRRLKASWDKRQLHYLLRR